jgi:excisionase family DNA binding protein
MDQLDLATSFAIFAAKQNGVDEVTADHILLGCLRTISRFGIATIGDWNIDLEGLGVDWVNQPEGPKPKVAYSQAAVELFDLAAKIARAGGESPVSVYHLLAAFSGEEQGLMGELKRANGITSASWRTAVARMAAADSESVTPERASSESRSIRDYLTPEEAAEALGVHVQTMRGYIRNQRLPAFRLAGERAIRILRTDLDKVLEPLNGEK